MDANLLPQEYWSWSSKYQKYQSFTFVLDLKSRAKHSTKSKVIQQNWAKPETFKLFCVIFDLYCEKFISGVEFWALGNFSIQF